ncbi:MAG: radical SAM protein [Candidatus Muirbacterium halophilum]|nr:radical SAM protein [Candidatus Muirbacterium halophilum]MCK9477165.1 radical SAM protein [Candidatus Muirbacterium halophilum]
MRDYKYLFGPVPSRRLGSSLGVDVVPLKICSLDCVYCEVGKTTDLTVDRKEYFPTDIIVEEIKDYLKNNKHPDYITFSGSGEPTLNISIGKIIDFIKSEYSHIPIAVLTNATLLGDKHIRKELLKADLILPSLDAGSKKVFDKINRPCNKIDFDNYIDGLIQLRKEFKGKYWLEVFILPEYNDSAENLEEMRKIVEKINPDSIQLNTLDRPGVLSDIYPASREMLENIKKSWKFDNIDIISRNNSNSKVNIVQDNVDETILSTIKRRPCTLEDLEEILGIHRNEINKHLSILENNKQIKRNIQNRGIFYSKAL